jgi:hypothetical protein
MTVDLCVLWAEINARQRVELAVLVGGNRSESPNDNVALCALQDQHSG